MGYSYGHARHLPVFVYFLKWPTFPWSGEVDLQLFLLWATKQGNGSMKTVKIWRVSWLYNTGQSEAIKDRRFDHLAVECKAKTQQDRRAVMHQILFCKRMYYALPRHKMPFIPQPSNYGYADTAGFDDQFQFFCWNPLFLQGGSYY